MEIELQNAIIGHKNVIIGSLKRHYKALEIYLFLNSILRKSSFKRWAFS